MEQFNVSERMVCRALSQPRSTQRYCPKIMADEERLIEQMINLATKFCCEEKAGKGIINEWRVSGGRKA